MGECLQLLSTKIYAKMLWKDSKKENKRLHIDAFTNKSPKHGIQLRECATVMYLF